LPHRSER